MNKRLATKLKELVDLDFKTREKSRKNNQLNSNYPQEMQIVHTNNAHTLNNIIEKHDWQVFH